MSDLTMLVVNHNNAHWLHDCFTSINHQSLPTFDLLFIDDSSTDDSVQYFENFPWRSGIRPRLIQTPQQLGVSQTRITGMRQVQTSYVTQLDSDDFLLSQDKLKQELNLVKRYPRGIAFSRIIWVDAEGDVLPSQPDIPILEGNLQLSMLARDCMIPRDFVLPLALYNEVGGYDPDINLYEDWDLKLRLAARATYHYTGLDGIAYRRHDSGLSAVSSYRHKEAKARVILKNLPLYLDKITLTELNTMVKGLGLTALQTLET